MHGKAAVTGLGYSDVGRETKKTEGELAAAASRAAIADAGLRPEDIDGLVMFPHRTSPPTGFQGPGLTYVQRALGLSRLSYVQSVGVEQTQFGAIFTALYAVLSGQVTHALVYRAHTRQRRRYLPGTASVVEAWDEEAFTLPFGAASGAALFAMWATLHMHTYGTTQEQLGSVVILAREHARSNPMAVWRDHPVTMEQYLASRWICTPFKLFDCDYPIDGAVALVISRSDVAASMRRPPAYIESIGHATGPDVSIVHRREPIVMRSRYAAAQLWSQTPLRPSDVQVAELYDGFSWLAISWLEALGFVAPGEGGPYFESGGGRVGTDVAVLTDGGQLGIGRLHGFSKLSQAVKQIRGQAGDVQVPGVEAAVACAGDLAAVLVTKEPVR